MHVLHIWPAEGKRKGTYLIGIVDTDSDKVIGPQLIFYPDDITRSSEVIGSFLRSVLSASDKLRFVSSLLVETMDGSEIVIPNGFESVSLPVDLMPTT